MENNFQIDSAAVSDRGLSEKRPQNEDSFIELSRSGIFAVADGVGGAQAGDVASQMAMEILGEAFSNLHPGSDPEEVMKLAIERANNAIFQMSHDLPQLSTMATTIVALHISGNIATIGHVGDSRLYRLDNRGELYRETQDHSVVEEEVRAGRMTAEQAAHHPSRNVISRALGAESLVEIDMKTIMFEPETKFLLCSDGITRHIQDHEIKELLNSGSPPDFICRQMKEMCYQRGAEDNLTAVIVKVSEEYAGKDAPAFDDEATVATARKSAAAANFAVVNTQPETIGASGEFTTREFSKANQISIPASVDEPDAPENKTNADTAPKAQPIYAEREVISYQEEKQGSGFFVKLLSSLALLLAGAALGAAAFYYFMPKPVAVVPPPVVNETPAANIEYKSFEDLRRTTDLNPQQYILSTQGKADDAEGFYLLGRAHLLTGNSQEARLAFTEAKNRLAAASDANSQILASEIAMGLAIVNTPNAAETFRKELPANAPAQNANSTTNLR
jgi:PPM family protein phosphatase